MGNDSFFGIDRSTAPRLAGQFISDKGMTVREAIEAFASGIFKYEGLYQPATMQLAHSNSQADACPKCGTPIQKFPTLGAELPCVNCTPGAMVKLPIKYAGGHVALIFEHVTTNHGLRWAPRPCIDRSVDADLTRRLTETGLTVCLVDSARPAQKEPQQSPVAPNTVSDNKGRYARDHVPDAVAGCRLGCACKEHRPPREPYVPSVTDWDLLPDV